MVDDEFPSGNELVPEESIRQLSLPANLINRGLVLSRRIQNQPSVKNYKEPIFKTRGVLNGSCIDFSRNGKRVLITSYGEKKVHCGFFVVNVETQKFAVCYDVKNAKIAPYIVYSVALSKSGDFGLVGFGDGRIVYINTLDPMFPFPSILTKVPGGNRISAIAISPDGQFFAECSGYYVHIRETRSGREITRHQCLYIPAPFGL